MGDSRSTPRGGRRALDVPDAGPDRGGLRRAPHADTLPDRDLADGSGRIRIRSGQHVLIVGQNRSGKSTLATRIANAWDRVLVLDPKLDPGAELPNAHIAIGVADALAHLPGRVVYRPTPAELDTLPETFDRLVRKIMVAGGGCGIVLHEVADVAPGRAARWLRVALMQGAGLSVSVVACTQRPRHIDRLVLSEARHVFLFTLTDPDDRERAAALMGRRGAELPNTPDPHGFYHRDPMGLVRRCKRLLL